MVLRLLGLFLCLNLCVNLSACSNGGDNYAPVTDLSHVEELPKSGSHCVTRGETLYAIAFRYGLDYRYLADLNQINPPYTIFIGQEINLSGKNPRPPPIFSPDNPKNQEPNYAASGWVWPTKGKVTHFFSANNKGIDIAGDENQPIYAAMGGKIVYSGNGLRGYGNLIIIKHNSLYLSAYAHNQHVFVKEGEWVKKGQVIAAMGRTGSTQVMLHFEIRREGKPINPLVVIPAKDPV